MADEIVSGHEKKKKPSRWWYLVPFFFGFIGGIIGYFAVRDRDKAFAKKLLIFGVAWTILLVVFQMAINAYMFTTWSAKTMESMKVQTEKEVQSKMETMQKTIAIEVVKCEEGNVYIRNTGLVELNPGDVKVTTSAGIKYNSEAIPKENMVTIDFGESLSGTVKAEAPGNVDSWKC